MSEAALKPEKDFSKEATKQIAECKELAQVRSTRAWRACRAMRIMLANTLCGRPTFTQLLKSWACWRSRLAR